MSDFDPKRLYDFNVKLCAAIKKHKCLYDRNSLHKNPPPECEIAWQDVAKECEESVNVCKNRWKGLLKSFFKSLKRRGARYYLHEHMEFLLEGRTKGKGGRKRKTSLSINDDTNSVNSLQPSLDDDISQQENLMETINLDEEEEDAAGGDAAADDSDSHTTSADESSELNNSREQVTVGGVRRVGDFIIDEIGEEADEDRKRLSYKRACKRGLDPEIINDLEEEEPGEKRTRRSAIERRKSLTYEEGDKQNSLGNKKVQVRVDKIKLIKPSMVGTPNNDNKREAKVDNMWPKKLNEEVNVNKMLSFQMNKIMVDRFTSTEKKFTDTGTQYEVEATNFDNIFLDSIKTQLQQMNARQKMNFKRKIYESLLEVFDDNTDFPSANDVLKVPPKTNPKLFNTTVGELRLMRELVSLVQASKNTPEIINNKEKVTISNVLTPTKPAATPNNTKPTISDNRSKTSVTSPLSLSPSLDDDDDLQFSLDNIDDDDDLQLPKSWDEIKLKPTNDSSKSKPQTNEENIMGLPKRVLQKVVKVAGTSGSTIVARDGDKKRIYRIYPKAANGLATAAGKSGNNIGSFYVAPSKTSTDSNTNSNKSQTGLPHNFTIRTLQSKSGNSSTETIITSTNNTPQTSTTMNAGNKAPINQTVFKNVHPANRILSATTGQFKMVPFTKPIAPPTTNKTITSSTSTATNPNTITRVTTSKSPMMPPYLPATKRTVQIRTHINTPQLMQRRYSICGPLPTEKSPAASPKAFIINKPAEKSSISQIQISQPISLNTKAQNTPPPKTTTTSNQNNFSSPNIPTKPDTNGSPPVTLPAPIIDLVDVKVPIKSLDKSQETLNPLQPLNVITEPTDVNPTEEIPILETAGTIGADNLDPLFVKPPQVKAEPL